MAATRLGSLAQVYGSRRNQTRKRMPTGSPAPLPCSSARLDAHVFFSAAAAFHFSTFICPRCGLRGPAVVHRSYRCMLTSSRALLLSAIRRLWPRPPTQHSHPYQKSASPRTERMNTLLPNVFPMGAGICQ